MEEQTIEKPRLFVTDIDNTIFDWVTYYTRAFMALLETVGEIISVDPLQLAEESKSIFNMHGSIEYPFVVQELPSVNQYFGKDIRAMLEKAVNPSREIFLEVAKDLLVTYPGVVETLTKFRQNHPNIPIVALTDAPRYVAMWKLNKLGVLNLFDSVYGLADPKLPTDRELGEIKVDQEILLKHLNRNDFGFPGKIRILPDEYEKPGTRGLKTVLMDYDLDEDPIAKKHVIWVGDNLKKDIGLGNRLGVRSFWARYGTALESSLMEQLKSFSPPHNVARNVYLSIDDKETPKPFASLDSFAEILTFV